MRIIITFIAVGLGAAAWTFLEYVLHRFLGHDRRTFPNPFASEHTRHHSEGNYFAPTWKKALTALLAFAIVVTLATGAAGLLYGPVFAAAFVTMYATYEVIHRRVHTHPGFGAYGRYLRRHHFYHHFENPRKNHGVTSPFWDVVFGTLESPEQIGVPQRLAMRWLVDPDTGQVRAEHRPFYQLVPIGGARSARRGARLPGRSRSGGD